jgi:lysophospholipase L1-like esterase
MAGSKLRHLRDGALLTFLAVALLILAEAGIRGLRWMTGGPTSTRVERLYATLDQTLGLYRPHPFLNTAPRSGAAVEAFGKSATFNSLGYRSPERPMSKAPGTVRILCAGGSTTFDLLAASDEETWPWLLEAALSAAGERVEVWNAGFPGWTSVENLISLAVRDADLQPDIVLLFQGINDLQPASHRPFDRQYVEGHAEVSRRALGLDRQPLAWTERSLLLEAARDAIFGAEDPWDRVRAAAEAGGRRGELAPEAAEVFARNVRSFVALVRGHGGIPVLATQVLRLRAATEPQDREYLAGWLAGLDPGAAPAALEVLNDVFRRVAEEDEVLLVDAAGELEWRDEHFADPMHFSAAGSRQLAELVASRLAPVLKDRRSETSG